MSPAAQFRPAGPRFRLLFGVTARDEPEASAQSVVGDLFIATPSVPEDIFGWGVIYAVHARACIERGRMWQAEHYVGAVRDHALSLACLREGLPAAQARGYDDLSAETLARFQDSHVGALEPGALRAALSASASHSCGRPGARVTSRPRRRRTPRCHPGRSADDAPADRPIAAARPSMWEHGAPSLLALDPGSRSLAETTKRKPRSLALVVLAAGKGKRMRSATPKVLHPIAGRAALWHVVQAGMAAKPTKIIVVVGHDAPQVEAEVRSWGLSPKPVFVVQRPQRGTAPRGRGGEVGGGPRHRRPRRER